MSQRTPAGAKNGKDRALPLVVGRTNVSLKQLWAFLSVAETANFTQSAAALHTTQSAVSTLIKELEQELGLRLFERTTRSVRLTDEGRMLRAPAHRVFSEFQSAIGMAKSLSVEKRSRVTVSASPLMSSLFLPAIIAEFHSRYPKISVTLRDAPFDRISALVLAGEADIGFGVMPEPVAGLVGEPMLSNELMLICPAGHPLAKLGLATWRDIVQYPFVALTAENGTRQLAERGAREVGITLKPAYEVSFIWTAIGMVDAGLGVSVIPRFVRSLDTAKNIVIREIAGKTSEPAVALLTRSDAALSPPAASFRAFMRKHLK